jgi:hypothetical protein
MTAVSVEGLTKDKAPSSGPPPLSFVSVFSLWYATCVTTGHAYQA